MNDKPEDKVGIKMGDTFLPGDNLLAKAVRDTFDLDNIKQASGEEVATGADDTTYVSPDEILASEPTPLSEVLEEVSQSAEMTYEDRLRVQGVSIDEAKKIVDAMITKNEFLKSYPIDSKHTVTFRTRRVDDNSLLLEQLETKSYGYEASIANHHTLYNMALSLHSIGATDGKGKRVKFDPDNVEQTLRYLGKLPTPYFVLLVNKLVKFEHLIAVVFEDGAIQNF